MKAELPTYLRLHAHEILAGGTNATELVRDLRAAADRIDELEKATAGPITFKGIPLFGPASPPAREVPALERPVCGAFQQHPVCVLLCERCLHPLTDHTAAPPEPAKETA
jgi:hypothetical protein